MYIYNTYIYIYMYILSIHIYTYKYLYPYIYIYIREKVGSRDFERRYGKVSLSVDLSPNF